LEELHCRESHVAEVVGWSIYLQVTISNEALLEFEHI
jgi:hypothetical protein